MSKIDTLLAQLPRYAGANCGYEMSPATFTTDYEQSQMENVLNDCKTNAVLASLVDGLVEALGIAKSYFEELETECPSGSPESNALIRHTISIGQVLARVAKVRAAINEGDKSSNE